MVEGMHRTVRELDAGAKWNGVYFDVAMKTVLLPFSFCCKSNVACLTV